MGRRLNTYVHVDGVAYGPDVDVPDEVAERITAPGVWVEPTPASDPDGEADSDSDGDSDGESAEETSGGKRRTVARRGAKTES